MKKLKSYLSENTMFDSNTKKDFIENRIAQLGTMFWINFLGVVSLYTIDPKNAKLISLLKGSPARIQNVDDTHSDLMVAIKELHGAQKLNQNVTDRITKLIALLKMSTIVIDENLIREISSKISYSKVYCHIKLRSYIDDFEAGKYALKDLTVPLFQLARHEKIATEFTDLAKHIIPKIDDEKSDIQLVKRGRPSKDTQAQKQTQTQSVSGQPEKLAPIPAPTPPVVKDFDYYSNHLPSPLITITDKMYALLKVWKMTPSERNTWLTSENKKVLNDFVNNYQWYYFFSKYIVHGTLNDYKEISNPEYDDKKKLLPKGLDNTWFTAEIKKNYFDEWVGKIGSTYAGRDFISKYLSIKFNPLDPEDLVYYIFDDGIDTKLKQDLGPRVIENLKSTNPEPAVKCFFDTIVLAKSANNYFQTVGAHEGRAGWNLIGTLSLEDTYFNWKELILAIQKYFGINILKEFYKVYSVKAEVRKIFKEIKLLGKPGFMDNATSEELADVEFHIDKNMLLQYVSKLYNPNTSNVNPLFSAAIEKSSLTSVLETDGLKDEFINSVKSKTYFMSAIIPWFTNSNNKNRKDMFNQNDDKLFSELIDQEFSIKSLGSQIGAFKNGLSPNHNIDMIDTEYPLTYKIIKEKLLYVAKNLTSKYDAYGMASMVRKFLTPEEIIKTPDDRDLLIDIISGNYCEWLNGDERIKYGILMTKTLKEKVGLVDFCDIMLQRAISHSRKMPMMDSADIKDILLYAEKNIIYDRAKQAYNNFCSSQDEPKELFQGLVDIYLKLSTQKSIVELKLPANTSYNDLGFNDKCKILFGGATRVYGEKSPKLESMPSADMYDTIPQVKEMTDKLYTNYIDNIGQIKDFLNKLADFDPATPYDNSKNFLRNEMSDKINMLTNTSDSLKIYNAMGFGPEGDERKKNFRKETYEILSLLIKKIGPEITNNSWEGLKLDLKDSPEDYDVDQKLLWLNLTYNEGVKVRKNWKGRTLKGELQKIQNSFAGDVGNIMFDIFYSDKKNELNGILDKLGDKKPIAVKSLKDAVVMVPLMNEIFGGSSPIRPPKQLTKGEILGLLKYNNFHITDTVTRVKTKKLETTVDMLERFVSNTKDLSSVADTIKLQVSEVKMEKSELEKMTAELGLYLAPDTRHGDIAGEIIQVFDADFKGDGFDTFKSQYPNTQLIPSFHGTSELYASMILRFGFKIANSSLESAAGIKVAGKALGPGVYLAKYCDKSMGYFKESGKAWTNRKGNYGFLFEMECYLGKPGEQPSGHHRSAGFKGSTDEYYGFKSPEYAIKTNAQWRIYRVYKIRTTNKHYIKVLQNKHNIGTDTVTSENTMFPKMFMKFKDFLRETEDIPIALVDKTSNEKPAGLLSFEFFENSIPVDNDNVMFVDDFADIYSNANISVQSTQLGWLIEFNVPVDADEITVIPDTDEWAVNNPDGTFSKFLFWLNKLKTKR